MTYKDIQEILNSKKSIPYPKLVDVKPDKRYAKLLYDSYGGNAGELNAITQYIYEHIEVNQYEEFSKILLSIAIEEMHHLDLLGDLIKKLGKKPCYVSTNEHFWNAKNVKYYFNNIHDMLMFNIKSEEKAIFEYKKAIKYTDNKSIKDLLERIILDEQTHIEIFNKLM